MTITGPGGVGKTRLAVHVAQELLEAYDGEIYFVDLARVADPVGVPSAIADVLGIADEQASHPLTARIATALNGKTALIVLDNCEHVVAAAAAVAEELIQSSHQARILATSREPLGVADEAVYRLQPFAEAEAVELFVARARSARRDFELTDENAASVTGIARRLDGIPLAIEIAAARLKALNLEQLEMCLEDRLLSLASPKRSEGRHRTLSAMIEWSYDLLSVAEQTALRQVAVFRGGCTLEAAEAICCAEQVAGWNIQTALEALVDKSLIVFSGAAEHSRYSILEPTRQFALARLTRDEAAQVGARHASFFAGVAKLRHDDYWRADTASWLASVRRDLDNFRAAIDWGLSDTGDPAVAGLIVGSLRRFWCSCASREGRWFLERVKPAIGRAGPDLALGLLALTEAHLRAYSTLNGLAAVEAAKRLAGVDEAARVEALLLGAQSLSLEGRLQETIETLKTVLVAARATQVPHLIARVLCFAANRVGVAGDPERASMLFEEAAMLLEDWHDSLEFAKLQYLWAELDFCQGDADAAIVHSRAAELALRAADAEGFLPAVIVNRAAYLLALGQFDEAMFACRQAVKSALTSGAAGTIVMAVGHVAHVAAERGNLARAASLLGYVNMEYDTTIQTSKRENTEQIGYDRTIALIRAALPEERISALMAEGAAMGQAAALAQVAALA